MANFTRTQLDAVWISGYQAPPADYEDLDRKAFQGINGKAGGVYAPTAVIAITGSGLQTTTKLEVQAGGNVRFATGATMVLADSDWQDLLAGHPGRTRKIYQAMAPFRVVGQDHFAVANILPMGAAQPLASEIRRSTGSYVPSFVKELRVVDGAKFARARLRFKVPTPHASAPQEMPKVRIFRVKNSDGTEQNLYSGSADGFASIETAKSGTGWYALGAVQEFLITLDQNQTVSDDDYTYFAHVVEERAGVAEYPHQLQIWEAAVIQDASNEPNAATGDCDSYGGVWPLGTVGLFKNETAANKRFQGVLTSPGGAGAWPRHSALNSEAEFRNGMLFVIDPTNTGVGKANPGTVWQLTMPPPFVLDVTDINIDKPVPKGTLFLGLVTEFENITDTRFQ